MPVQYDWFTDPDGKPIEFEPRIYPRDLRAYEDAARKALEDRSDTGIIEAQVAFVAEVLGRALPKGAKLSVDPTTREVRQAHSELWVYALDIEPKDGATKLPLGE